MDDQRLIIFKMRHTSLALRYNRNAFLAELLLVALLFSAFFQGTLQTKAFSTSQIVNTGAPASFASTGEENVLIMNFVLPDPATDPLISDGATVAVAGDTLTTFDAGEKFGDEDHDDALDYSGTEIVVNSPDPTITSSDVIKPGTADLVLFTSTEPSLLAFADNGTADGQISSTEDIYRQIHNGADVFTEGVSTLEDFPFTTIAFDDVTIGDNGNYDEGEAIMEDSDASGSLSEGDDVITAGKANVYAIQAADNVMLEDSNSDGNYDTGEVIWADADNNDAFNTGTDFVIVGSAAPTCGAPCLSVDTLTNESGLAFLDITGEGSYSGMRNVGSEALVWFGNGTNPTDGDTLSTSVAFFTAANLGGSDDDILGSWFASANSMGSMPDYYYTVTSADAPYSDGDDIFTLANHGATASGDGTMLTAFDGVNDKFSDFNNNNQYDELELVAISADNILSGAEIAVGGNIDVQFFNSNGSPYYKYIDDGDSSLELAEDIVQDVDLSGFYNAARLGGITITNTGTALNADLDGLSVWEDDGDNTFEADQDAEILLDQDGVYFFSPEVVAGTSYIAGQRIFVTVDVDVTGGGDGDPTHGATIIAQLADNSGGDGNCDNNTQNELACAIRFTVLGPVTSYNGPDDGNITNPNTITLNSADLLAPTGLASFTAASFSSSEVVLTWAAAADANFNHYEIWYGADQSDVQNRTGTAVEWDDSDDVDLATAGTSTTTIAVNPSDKYFKIFAIDDYDNESTVADILPNQSPTVSGVTGELGADASGEVTITFTVDDADDDELEVEVEYSLDGGGTWGDPTILSVDGESGTPALDNGDARQLTAIETVSGANEVTAIWDALADEPGTDVSNARIRITPYDGTIEGGTGTSANFIIDLEDPTGLANFTYGSYSATQVVLTWTAAADTNFNHYEIWYGQDQSDVQSRAASEWDDDNDASLATAGTTTTTLTADPRNRYFKIFAVDDYGNESEAEDFFLRHSSGTAGGGGGGGGSNNSSNDSSTDEGTNEDSGWGITDLEDHWASNYLNYLEDEPQVEEAADDLETFRETLDKLVETPDDGVNRGEATEFLIVLIEAWETELTGEMPFTDVPEDHSRAAFIQVAYELGLVDGYPNKTFQPELVINRVETLKFVTEFFGLEVDASLRGTALLEAYELSENPFTDVDLDSWYAPYVIHAYANGVVSGYGDGTFGPGNYVTCAELLKMAILYQNFENAIELAEDLE